MKTPEPKPDVGVLDHDILQALDAAQSSPADTRALHERVRRRVMQRIAQDCAVGHMTIAADQDSWQPFLPGVERKVLHEAAAIMSCLLRIAPGAVVPAHGHLEDEECVVLSGVLRIGGELELRAGDFHLARKGLAHASIETETGATIFLRGAIPRAEDLI